MGKQKSIKERVGVKADPRYKPKKHKQNDWNYEIIGGKDTVACWVYYEHPSGIVKYGFTVKNKGFLNSVKANDRALEVRMDKLISEIEALPENEIV